MRILVICYEYPPVGGGGATFCEACCEALVQSGHEVDVVTSGMADLPTFEQRNGVDIHRVRCFRRHRYYATSPELLTQVYPSYRKALELQLTQPYDVCHCHFVVPSGLTAYMLQKKTGLPYVLTAHGSDIPGYNPDRFSCLHRLIRPAWTRIMRASDAVTTPSRFLRGLINRQIDIPVQVVPCGFDPISRDGVVRRNRLLVASRVVERKGIQFLIRALEQIDTDWEICVAGDGPYLPEVKKLAAELSVRVNFLGFIPRDKLIRLYESARVFVFPSIQENFPLVLLEAMAGGCAIVTTSAPGCAEVVGDAAVKVKPGCPNALREAVSRLLTDGREIERLGKLGAERIADLAWCRIIERYEAVFRGVAEIDESFGMNTRPPCNQVSSSFGLETLESLAERDSEPTSDDADS